MIWFHNLEVLHQMFHLHCLVLVWRVKYCLRSSSSGELKQTTSWKPSPSKWSEININVSELICNMKHTFSITPVHLIISICCSSPSTFSLTEVPPPFSQDWIQIVAHWSELITKFFKTSASLEWPECELAAVVGGVTGGVCVVVWGVSSCRDRKIRCIFSWGEEREGGAGSGSGMAPCCILYIHRWNNMKMFLDVSFVHILSVLTDVCFCLHLFV